VTTTAQTTYRVGELARVAGVTVRALHHYDSLGLLSPSERTSGGHRLYAARDVERLYRLLALRGLGLPLEEIGPLLDRDAGVADTVRRHLTRVEHQLAALTALRTRLSRLLGALDGGEESTQWFLDALEAMSMFEKYYTREQLQQLEERRNQFGPEQIKAVEDEWRDLYAQVRRHRESGTDPADPAVQALVTRSGELIRLFTGGDPGIEASLKRMYEEEGPARASRGVADPADLEYLEKARASRS
jgi:MerR family transcriptional regulator, thiopeptide resistance regulator